MSKPRKDALAGSGPIVDRARAALRQVAPLFGEVISKDHTSVSVRTPSGMELNLSYAPGNYLFSRVYNLRITTVLPAGVLPAGLRLNHQSKSGPRWVAPGASSALASPRVTTANKALAPLMGGIDLVSGTATATAAGTQLSLTPMGGSFVWVLIPPVFKATAFPAGEPERIVRLIEAAHGLAAHSA